MHHQITPGAVVLTADDIALTVRALEGNVAELEAADGSWYGYRHVSSLTPVNPQAGDIECLPPATQTAPVPGLAAAAGAGQGECTKLRHKLLQDGAPGSHRWRCACGQWSAETPAKGPYGRTTMRARMAQLNMAYAKHVRFAEARA